MGPWTTFHRKSKPHQTFVDINNVVGTGVANEELKKVKYEKDISDWKSTVDNLNTQYPSNIFKDDVNTEIDTVLDFIKKKINVANANDLTKAWGAYAWISTNVNYNVDQYNYKGTDQTIIAKHVTENKPERVVKTRSCVCEGYSNLYKVLCEKLNLKCEVVKGYSKGSGFVAGSVIPKEDHAWNAVKISGQWELVECTWGAGHLDSNQVFKQLFSQYWFSVPPQIFINNHLCVDFQPQTNTITKLEFEQAASYEIQYYLLDIYCNQTKVVINVECDTHFIELETPKNIMINATINSKHLIVHTSSKQNNLNKLYHCIIIKDLVKGQKYMLKIGCLDNTDGKFTQYFKYDVFVTFILIKTSSSQTCALPIYDTQLIDSNVTIITPMISSIFETRDSVNEFSLMLDKEESIHAKLYDADAYTNYDVSENNKLDEYSNMVICQWCPEKIINNQYYYGNFVEILVKLPEVNKFFILLIYREKENGRLEPIKNILLIRYTSIVTLLPFVNILNNNVITIYIYDPLIKNLKISTLYNFTASFKVKETISYTSISASLKTTSSTINMTEVYKKGRVTTFRKLNQSFSLPGDVTLTCVVDIGNGRFYEIPCCIYNVVK